ncbi:sigma 54-interacting transcriptional regulator [Pelagibaculum spongiae]|uniref:Sigma-54 factor interaction domain-containing protein n=1 Tax=Pelagibaculum spongiae TaxID=2080658 RepID=A0A2V1H1R7_9GAMM|nr:sigma 54-interacting transcriptional regulator [Pelagibaculum spongiae]PVZ70382.1 hypothetical protein DC094_07250 [Pelagibaculum spongiae]
MLTAEYALDKDEFTDYLTVLETIAPWVQGDAYTLLRLEPGGLKPLVSIGLVKEAMGRSFLVTEQPWLKAVLLSENPVRFIPCELSSHPLDGLLLSKSLIQDSYGVRLMVHEQCWGILLMDAAQPQQFHQLNQQTLQAVCSMVEARVQSLQTLEQLRTISSDNLPSAMAPTPTNSALAGNSIIMRQLRQQIVSAANSNMTVMICGEAGTGKRLVARELHRLSGRSGSMQLVDCQALPVEALDSELFGLNQLGAVANKHLGKLKQACQGTLVISSFEILPLSAQRHLTNWLQKNASKAASSITLPARILVTTSVDLPRAVAEGKVLKELYQRLSAYSISVPKLNERGEDLELLAGFYLEQQKCHMGLRVVRLSDDAIQALYQHRWPGNVPELAQRIYRAVRIQPAGHQSQLVLEAESLGLDVPDKEPVTVSAKEGADLKDLVDDYQRQLIRHHLQLCNSNWAHVARSLQVDRSNLYRLAKRLGLK